MANENETIAIPSYNPSDSQSFSGTLDFIINKVLTKIEKVAPAKILTYDRSTNRASVQILNLSITSTGEKIERRPIDNIPVLILSGGGFAINFPIKENDIGWLVSADSDISIFKSILKTFAPATYQKHRYKDSFFIPDKVNGFTISETDTNALLLTSHDGLNKIALSQNGIAITGNTSISGNLTVTGEVTGKGIALSTHTHNGVTTGEANTGLPQ